MSSWETKHHCPHCKQGLKAVHPLEIKREIWILSTLANNPKAKKDAFYRTIGGTSVAYSSSLASKLSNLGKAARTAAALEIEPDTSKWKDWLPEDYRLAAQKLSDMWLPPGYICDPHLNLDDYCRNKENGWDISTNKMCSGDIHVDSCLRNPDYLKDYK